MNTAAQTPRPLSKSAASNTGRPKRSPPERRNYKHTVRLSATENAALKLRAEQMGMRPAQFIRQVALTCLLPPPPLLQGEQQGPRPDRALLGPVAHPKQLTHSTLLGFFFVLVLFLVMALMVSTEAEGTDAPPAPEEDVSATPPEIPAPPAEAFAIPPAPSLLSPPSVIRPYIPSSIFDLETQISDLESDIFIMKLFGLGFAALVLLFLGPLRRGNTPPPPRESLREREIEVLLAALERQGAVLGNVGQVLADRIRPRAD